MARKRDDKPFPATVTIRYFTLQEAEEDPHLMELARKQRAFGWAMYQQALKAGLDLLPEEVNT